MHGQSVGRHISQVLVNMLSNCQQQILLAHSRSMCWSKSVELVLFHMSAIMSTDSQTRVGRRDPYNVREHRKEKL